MGRSIEKVYEVRQGYHTLGVGTLTQCQAVQKALDKLKLVTLQRVIDADGNTKHVYVEDNEEGKIVVGPADRREILSAEEYRRASTRKITMQPK